MGVRKFPRARFFAQGDRHRRSTRITEETWELYRPLLCKLYKSYTLQVVMTFMQKRFEFSPTKRQYGYRFEKWGVKKYGSYENNGSARSPASNEESPYEQIETDVINTMPQYLNFMMPDSTPFLEVPSIGRNHRARSIASATSGASDNAASFGDDDTDVEYFGSPPSPPSPSFLLRYQLGPAEETKKLIADFCSSVSDEENAFILYANLVEAIPDTRHSMETKVMIVTSSARVANHPENAKRARELLSNQACIYSGIQDRSFLFSVLDSFMEEQENPSRKDEAHNRVCDAIRGVLHDDTTLRDIHHNCTAIDLVTYSFLSLALETYENTPATDNGSTPTLSTQDLLYQYVYQQPFADTLQNDKPSVLRICVNWCTRQLRLNLKIPNEVASIPCDDERRSWCDDIHLYCTLWHRMMMAVQNETPPPWYGPCEQALGISPSELLVIVCWMIGAEAEEQKLPQELLQRASTAVVAISRWDESALWIKFLRRFMWMNKLVDLGEEDKAFEAVILKHTRHYISATLNMPLPFPVEEPIDSDSSTPWDCFLQYDTLNAMEH